MKFNTIITAAVLVIAGSVHAQTNQEQPSQPVRKEFQEIAEPKGAKFGYLLTTAPMARADNNLYYLYGQITYADENPVLMAASIPSQEVMETRGSRDPLNKYFYVVIPKELQDAYFKEARLGKRFNVIARYTSNSKYQTVGYGEKIAPVLQATSFEFWK